MFTKLFSSITTSSIWNEDNNTRIVWITMLAMSNKDGYVSASLGGLAHEARVSREDCESALKVLTSPDNDSRSKEFDGRRVEIVDGGFQLLNHAKYRAMRSEEERKEYMKTYMVEYRARTKNVNKNVKNVSVCKPPLAKAEAEAEAEADKIKNKKAFNSNEIQIPDILKTERFKAAWNDWIPFRRGFKVVKDPEHFFQNQINELAGWGEEDAFNAIKLSLMNGYQGIFKPKSQKPYQNGNSGKELKKIRSIDEYTKGGL